MVRAFGWGRVRPRRPGEPKPNTEDRATAARPTSRFLCPRPPLRSFTKEMGQDLKARSAKAPKQPFGHRGCSKGCEPISSEPAPSHRPWASAAGATPQRTDAEHGRAVLEPELQPRSPLRTQKTSASTKPATRSLTKEELGTPRRLADRCCEANSAATVLDVPAWGATPRGSVSDYDKEKTPRALGYFFT
jgi:hypothetical protein